MSQANYVQRVSQYRCQLFKKKKKWGQKHILVFTVSPGSYFLLPDAGVAAVTAEPNLPGLLSDTDLSFLMIRSNSRPLTSSRYISAASAPIWEREKKKPQKTHHALIVEHNHFSLHLAFNAAAILIISVLIASRWAAAALLRGTFVGLSSKLSDQRGRGNR